MVTCKHSCWTTQLIDLTCVASEMLFISVQSVYQITSDATGVQGTIVGRLTERKKEMPRNAEIQAPDLCSSMNSRTHLGFLPSECTGKWKECIYKR